MTMDDTPWTYGLDGVKVLANQPVRFTEDRRCRACFWEKPGTLYSSQVHTCPARRGQPWQPPKEESDDN